MMRSFILSLSCAFAVAASSAYDPLNPPPGVAFGAWVDSVQPGRIQNPSDFNNAIGHNAIAFQLPQSIPIIPGDPTNGAANLSTLDDGTDAVLFLTVYPNTGSGTGIDQVRQADLDALANQLAEITRTTGRNIMLRYAPEMNGNGWFLYQAATDADFIAHWQKMYTTVKAKNPQNVAIVWSPNLDQSSGDTYKIKFPGADYVDWFGMSIYWKGYKGQFPWHVNIEGPPDFFSQILDGYGSQGTSKNFYNNYVEKYNKPFVLAEGGAGYVHSYTVNHGPSQPGDGTATQAQMAMSFWNTFLFNPTFLASHPLFKMAIVFEIAKTETESNYDLERDYRLTHDPATLNAFTTALNNADGLVWANPVSSPLPASTSSSITSKSVATTTAATTSAAAIVSTVASTKGAAKASSSSATRGLVGGIVTLTATFFVSLIIV